MSSSIATWFVADTFDSETVFPQVGSRSSSFEFQAIYWRCVVCFYSTSLLKNPFVKHVFFTNTDVPVVDGFDILNFFKKNNIGVIRIPITYRLSPNVAGSWGNQFYILDIIKYIAKNGDTDNYLVLDSDCVWNGTAESIIQTIERDGCVLYTLGKVEYPIYDAINGVTRQQMGEALSSWKRDFQLDSEFKGIDYHGGEIFGASIKVCKDLVGDIDSLWAWQKTLNNPIGFLEEAHFLSILYALNNFKSHNANGHIKRMWTTFKHNNILMDDVNLDIWHMPSEKKTGFLKLYGCIINNNIPEDPDKFNRMLRQCMGVPKKNFSKFICDLCFKLKERFLHCF